MADAAGFDAQTNAASRRINERTLHEFHFSRRSDLNGTKNGHGGKFLSGSLSVACATIRIDLHGPAFGITGERSESYTKNGPVRPGVHTTACSMATVGMASVERTIEVKRSADQGQVR